ncbi:Tripartite tricarboxylate transporter family receptor [Variovorax boronicumulans]|uniref:Bug family tripartite tricarboxylate transporter substrate binding protein n=1 Tax=Variovorax boronicumulans TaxID=436515 RepID=UPI001552C3FE|nr:tripartite tricarboxylate transporter substrate binding protein [Variovorax boronicumulans]PBI95786.1 Tripartite tricarboxylate transporter family receptor [Variovorax boronicumulans]
MSEILSPSQKKKRLAGLLRGAACAVVVACLGLNAGAAGYPDRPVRLVVNVQPGGATDTAARIVGQKLSERLGQPILIDNRPGAGTRLGTDMVIKAKPDGYTLGVFYGVSTMFHLMFDNQAPLEPGKDFEAVSLFARAPSFLAVNAALPVKTVPEFVAYARSKNGAISYGHSGEASAPSLAAKVLLKSIGVQGISVAYKGNGPTAVAIASGEIDFSLVDFASVQPLVQRGVVRLIAITEPKRSALAPAVPTTGEFGITREVDGVTPWFLLAAPAGTSAATVALLNKHVVEILGMPDVQQRLRVAGVDVEASTPAQAAAYFVAQRNKMTAIVRDLGVSLKGQ